MIHLRDYQIEIYVRTREALRDHDGVIIQSSTGSGKTCIAAAMAATGAAKQRSTIYCLPRMEILKQSVRALEAAGAEVQILHGRRGSTLDPSKVTVTMLQTLSRRLKTNSIRMIDGSPLRVDTMLIDECHYGMSMIQGVLDQLRPAVEKLTVIGFSATPCRLDGKPLRAIGSAIIEGPPVAHLIETERLCPYQAFSIKSGNLDAVAKIAGDFDQEAAGEAQSDTRVIKNFAAKWDALATGRYHTIVFCSSIKHARKITDEMAQIADCDAYFCCGEDSAAVIAEAIRLFRVADGRRKALVNVGLFIEGLDIVEISCVADLAPTMSLSRFIQKLGRGMRMCAGKADVLILDGAANSSRLKVLPDTVIIWSIDGKARVATGADGRIPEIVNCVECGAAFRAAVICPACGARQSEERSVREVAADFVRVTQAQLNREAVAERAAERDRVRAEKAAAAELVTAQKAAERAARAELRDREAAAIAARKAAAAAKRETTAADEEAQKEASRATQIRRPPPGLAPCWHETWRNIERKRLFHGYKLPGASADGLHYTDTGYSEKLIQVLTARDSPPSLPSNSQYSHGCWTGAHHKCSFRPCPCGCHEAARAAADRRLVDMAMQVANRASSDLTARLDAEEHTQF